MRLWTSTTFTQTLLPIPSQYDGNQASRQLTSHTSVSADTPSRVGTGTDLDNDQDQDTSPSTDVPDNVLVLAITNQGQQLGAAAYDPACNKLLFLEDAPSAGSKLGFEEDVLNQETSLADKYEEEATTEGVADSDAGTRTGPHLLPKHELVSLREWPKSLKSR